jgi:hypothetical protein
MQLNETLPSYLNVSIVFSRALAFLERARREAPFPTYRTYAIEGSAPDNNRGALQTAIQELRKVIAANAH